MRIVIEPVKPNIHILWCRNCNEVRMGVKGTCAKCRCEMWNLHKPDALDLLGEEACNPGTYAPELVRLAAAYVGKDAACQAAERAIADKLARIKRREGKLPCTRGHHRVAQDGACDYCGQLLCRHDGCGNLAGEEGMCGRHRREQKRLTAGTRDQFERG
ncbi:MAG: hypothetical protein ABSD27_03400 [Bryobacteraceae bacterium]